MTIRISELNELSADLSQLDVLPIVDISASETKQITTGNFLAFGISGAPSSFIDLGKLNQNSATKLGAVALENTGVASGVYGDQANVASFVVNSQGLITSASGVVIIIPASNVTGLAPVATSGTYESLTNLPLLGTISSQNADNITISGGTISNVVFSSNAVDISGGTISGITALAVDDGGTGAATASGARTNLGLAIGSDVQAYSAVLSGVVEKFNDSDLLVYSSASGVVESAVFTNFARSIVSGETASDVRTTLGLGTVSIQDADSIAISGGTISNVTFSSGAVTISGGTISGITDLAIEDGGTGASSASDARTNLGLAIGSDVQAHNSVLDQSVLAFDEANVFIYSSASGVIATGSVGAVGLDVISGSTASGIRSTLELGTIAVQNADSVVIAGGVISGVSLTSDDVDISGGTISGITDLEIADGGTGASTAEDARANLGLAIGSDVQAYSAVLSGVASSFTNADEIIYASASGIVSSTPFTSFARSIASGVTASDVRATLGLGTIAVQNADSVVITGGTISGITDLAIADGGTGASDASTARTNLGLAIGSDVQAFASGLASIAGLTTAEDELVYLTGVNTYAVSPFPSFARNLLASGNSDVDMRADLGLGAIATRNVLEPGDVGSAVVSGDNIISGSIISANYGSGSILEAALADSAVTTIKIIDSGVTADKLADNSSTIVDAGAPAITGNYVGQHYFDSDNKFDYIWDGSSWEQQAAITDITISGDLPASFSVTYPDDFSAIVSIGLDQQPSNTFFAGPDSGVDAAPTFRSIESTDLPAATPTDLGAVFPGAGLQVGGDGQISHSNVTEPGTYAGAVTIDAQGHVVSAAAALQASDIPALDASIITTGEFTSDFLADNSVTASQLADYGIAQISESAPTPEFAGQWWINPNDRAAYVWVGSVSPAIEGYWLNLGYGSPTQINLRFGGTYNASGNTVDSINSYGIEAGLTVGQGLSSPSTSNNGVYLIVTASGVGTNPAPLEDLSVGNWVLSEGIGSNWTKVNLSSAVAGVADQDVLVAGASLVPSASGVASQEDLNLLLWARAQIATTAVAGIVRASSSIAVASGTGIMTVSVVDDGTF
jgi:hypothetical protein